MDGQDPAQPGNADEPIGGVQAGGPVQPEPSVPPPPPAPYYAPPPPPQAPYYAPVPAPPPPPYYAPPAAVQYAPPPAARPRRTGRVLLILGLILLLILAALAGGAVLANASLSSTYSPEKAVTDYLAAQKRGDVNFMIANANYLKGDGSFSEYFNQGGLGALMSYPQNTDVSGVKVSSSTVVDDNTRTVNVSMTWSGHQVARAFTVHKDLTRQHYSFYYSWRVDIPFATIHVTLPNQPGTIAVDGITLPPGATHDIQVIQGFHKVTMNGTDLYATASADADAIDAGPSVAFPSKISATATAAAAATIKKAFGVCSPAKYTDCLKHLYHSPGQPGFIYFFNLPGYGEVDYNTYVYTLTRDETVGMHLAVLVDPGKVAVNGVCAYTMTVDGSRKYFFKGTWKGTLTMSGGKFGYDLLLDCERSKA